MHGRDAVRAARAERESAALGAEVAGWTGRLAVQVGTPEVLLGASAHYVQWVRVTQQAVAGTVRARSEALPFPENSVEAVFLAHALEEADSPSAVLAEAVRILRGEGRLVVVGLRPSLPGTLRGLVGRAAEQGGTGPGRRIGPLQLHRLVRRAGLAWERWTILDCTPFAGRLPGACRRLFAGSYAAIAVKREARLTILRPAWRRSARERRAVVHGAGRAG